MPKSHMPKSQARPLYGGRADRPVANAGRVMIVDDSGVLRGVVSQWIDAEPDLEVVGRHANGKQAVDHAPRCVPDVIILDIDMPVMGGLEALPLLKRACPDARVLIVSTLTKRNARLSLKALELGAVDCLPKPDAQRDLNALTEFRQELLRIVRGLVPTRVEPSRSDPKGRAGGAGDGSLADSFARRASVPGGLAPGVLARGGLAPRAFAPLPPRVIVIGSSTGGPEALCVLLSALAPSLGQTPVLIAQHMPPVFTAALAERVGRASGMAATEARDGLTIFGGQLYVAPGDGHMTIAPGAPGMQPRIAIGHGPAVKFYRPSVDVLFDSAARVFADRTLGIVLTGMGTDGASGAKRIAEAGGSVIAQDSRTSVVWGMPGAAADAGACAAVLPLEEIATAAARLIAGSPPGYPPGGRA